MVSKVASAVLQQNLPPKLKDLGSFNINITMGDKKIAKAMLDLGASINLMPYSIYLQLGLGELKPTTMTLQLADRSVKYPKGIVEDLLVQVNKLIVPIDFVVLEMEEVPSKDKEHPILLGRLFMPTTKTIIDVHKGKLSMTVLGETVEFKVFGSLPIPSTSTYDEYSFINCVDSLVYDTYLQEKIEDKLEAAPTLDRVEETLDEETKGFHEILDRAIPVLPQEKSIKPLELPTSPYRDEPNPPNLELKKLPKHLKYVFLGEGDTYLVIILANLTQTQEERLVREFSRLRKAIGYYQVPIVLEDQGNTTFTCPFGMFAFRRLSFGLCNALTTFQRCMLSIFSNMVEKFIEHGIVLGHVISSKGNEVDKAKIVLIAKLPPPTSVKGIRSFLGHARFYRRFIKDFSKISRPLCNLLSKDVPFLFDDDCLIAFNTLKEKITSSPIIMAPNWSSPFEIMCDASDYAIGAVLGQKVEKRLHVIYYASRTLNDAQLNYSTTEKEFLAILFALEKFRSYLIGSKVIVHSNHAALRYLLTKSNAKPRLIRWVLLLQEFDLEIRDKKGSENVVANHLSRLISHFNTHEHKEKDIVETFPGEQLFVLSREPWYADIVNYLACGLVRHNLAF
ncbi:uncharacterized protein LOC116131647 [Pistacia vera]|uniref:uncharacterized protein LOC116131647 n=1 Tax=Pistacia vera TaxID=55513 RepID=UPI001262F16A|nr:uncharacterized protein LOC116131647 [Pistacia vera]